ncbi:hypothetical protein L1987_84702 [Smallanthus sonchifolius]|uniref:Uncharacterized protein n=1 Tax=Smallanthus sonchifolius TaxID=185202 RepID=A0ACB8XV36_9ASTR|nr:hypothetical protein L1987_84702 [Smallanthus sonchifolius]
MIVLFLYNNQIEGLVPNWIWNNSQETLRIFALRNNLITGFDQHPSFLPLIRLQSFDLAFNQLQGRLPIPPETIIIYDVSHNNLTGEIPPWICEVKSLRHLDLSSNKMTGTLPPCLDNVSKSLANYLFPICKGLSYISTQFLKLRIIDISSNNFSGQLPDMSFQTWNAMKSVDLAKSYAMGFQIPFDIFVPLEVPYSMTLTNKGVKTDILPSLGNLKNLESLDLSQNELSGKIPLQLLQLGFLAILNVSFNHLNGRLPQGKQFNTFANTSYLGNHDLCGKPLSKECEKSKVSIGLPPASSNEYEFLLPSDIIDWMVILSGVGSGLVIGIVIGSFLYARYGDWLLERLGMKKDRWVRPLRNTKRN